MEKSLMMTSTKDNDSSSSAFQRTAEVETHTGYLGPTLTYCRGHVVRYDTNTPIFSLWALFTSSHSMIQSRRTWIQVLYMAFVAIVSFVAVHAKGIASSIRVVDLATEVRILVSFVLGGYIIQCINRWSKVTALLTDMIDRLAKLMMAIDYSAIEDSTQSISDGTRSTILRYSRLCIHLAFFNGSRQVDMSDLVEEGILLSQEKEVLERGDLSFRSDVLCGWMHKILLKTPLKEKSFGIVSEVRSCHRELVGQYHAQLPFTYTHCVYWGLQFIFLALACQTGIMLAIFMESKDSGAGAFDDDESPEKPNVWLTNASFSLIASKVIFILFANGLLHVSERVQNPLDGRMASYCRFLLDDNFVQSCAAYAEALSVS